MNTLFKIQHAADTLSEIDFADQPKQHATEVGKEVHSQLGDSEICPFWLTGSLIFVRF